MSPPVPPPLPPPSETDQPTAPATIDRASTRRGAKPSCRHCGAPLIDDRMAASGFCCAGCSYVYRLIHEQGLGSYYDIKDSVTAPADSAVFQPRDFSWIEGAQRDSESAAAASGTPPELTVDVQGISCAGCVWLIERVFQQLPGARDIEANAQLGQARFRWLAGQFSAAELARRLQGFGYLLGPVGEQPAPLESRGLVKRIGLCAAFAMNVMLFALPAYFGMEPSYTYAGLFSLLAFGFGTLSFLVGGTYFVSRAARALREGAMHIDLPIAIGVLGAYLGSVYGWATGQERFLYFDFVSVFILLMLVGRWAQIAAVERNQRRLLSQQTRPAQVTLADGTRLSPERLQVGQRVALASGQILPVDARLESASAEFSLATVNGEAEPRLFCAGQRVPAGALNVGRGAAELTTLQVWNDSLLAQLLRPAARAGARHAFLERIIRGYLIGIIALAVLAGAGWWFATGDAPLTWSIVTAVLVVSCPCAIGLAFPLADEMATVALRRRGVLVRDPDLWPKLNRVRQLAFDKTGTLTLEMPVLQNPEALHRLDHGSRWALFQLVSDNPHPVSQCLLENLLAEGPIAPPPGAQPGPPAEIRESIGFGVESRLDGASWSLGRPGWRAGRDLGPNTDASPVGPPSDVELSRDGAVLARFRVADLPRPDARGELDALSALGFRVHILSGDRRDKVEALAESLGIPRPQAHGELTPVQKAEWVTAHDRGDLMMLGDGANDSLAFDRASCRGTPVIHRGVLEQKADFFYLGRGIGGLRALFAVNARRRFTQQLILVFSVVYNLLAVGLAVAGHMNPLLAAILMPVNSLLTLAIVLGGMRRAFA